MEALGPAPLLSFALRAADGPLDAAVGRARETAVMLGAAPDVADAVAAATAALARAVASAPGEGELVVAPTRSPWGPVLDVIAIDARVGGAGEPAAQDVAANARALRVGEAFAPAGTFGPLAPAVHVTAARAWLAGEARRPPFDVATFVRPYPGCESSGDAVHVQRTPRGVRVAVVDALGHGDAAAQSARALVAFMAERAGVACGRLVHEAHAARAAAPRGAALAVLDVDEGGAGAFVGVGNIEAHAIGAATRPASAAGTIGVALPRVMVEPVELGVSAAVALVSDGLVVRWPSFAQGVVAGLDAPVLLGMILATADRRRDDASAVVVRRPE